MRRLLAIVLLGAAVAACGVPLQSTPETLDVEVRSARPLLGVDPAAGLGSRVYLVSDDRLVPVPREPTDNATALLDVLLGGALPDEEGDGLRSAIPSNTVGISTSVAGNEMVVDLSRAFASVGGEEEILAVAQIVLTMTAGSAEFVRIHLDGSPTPLPLPSGALTTDPVGFADYAVLAEG